MTTTTPTKPRRPPAAPPPLVRGILFSPPMRRAIRNGSKSMTRRVIREFAGESWIRSVHQDGGGNWVGWSGVEPTLAEFTKRVYPNGEGVKPPFPVGTLLYVKEPTIQTATGALVGYFDDGCRVTEAGEKRVNAIFMPRAVARLWLRVVRVKAEQVTAISEEDAKAEGVEREFRTCVMHPSGCGDYKIPLSHRGGFANLWNAIHAKHAENQWELGPYVWAYGFRVLGPEEIPL